MDSWVTPMLPDVVGSGRPLRLFDTSSGSVVVAAPGPVAQMYVCGITPYDATHLGHAATYVAFDLIGRMWRDNGQQVRYVQNVTDIDDPLLERAALTGADWREVALRETALFRADMVALRIIPPDAYVGAVEAIPLVVDRIEDLQAQGVVYRVGEDLYLDIHADERFGAVAGRHEEEMRSIFAERGGDPHRIGKRHPLDPLMWKAAAPGDPSWPTRIGSGRPGWHIECVAIALEHLTAPIDVQGGGSDLAFPHHEMGASMGHLLSGWPFARAYVHAGMVGLDGHKMSKSRGNLVFVSQLRADGVDPAAIRLALLSQHYRSDWMWEHGLLDEALVRLARWRAAFERPSAASAAELVDRLRDRLSDDLDAPGALRAVDAWAARAGADEDGPRQAADAVDALLGVR